MDTQRLLNKVCPSLRRWSGMLAGALSATGLVLLPASSAIAASFSLTKIADSQEVFPGVPFPSGDLFVEPAVDDQGNVVFDSLEGLYSISSGGTPSLINTPGLLPRFSDIDGDTVTFSGLDTIFRADLSGNVAPLIGLSSPLSNLGIPTSFLFGSDGSDISVVTTDTSFESSSLYAIVDGNVQLIADSTTLVPGRAEIFSSLSVSDVSNGNVLFSATGADGSEGIYLSRDGNLETVVDNTTPIPNGPGTFRVNVPFPEPNDTGSVLLSFVALDGDDYVFTAFDETGTFGGLFTNRGGTLRAVFDTNTPVPGGTGTFAPVEFNQDLIALLAIPAISEQVIAFQTFMPVEPSDANNFLDAGPQGIYVEIDGELQKVVDTDDSLDGKEIRSLGFFNPNGLSDNFLVFSVEFEDDGQALYQVEFDFAAEPEPESVPEGSTVGGLLAIAGAMTWAKRRLVKS